MLDLARWRVDTQHHHRDPSLPDSVGHYFPAVVSEFLCRQVWMRAFRICGHSLDDVRARLDDFVYPATHAALQPCASACIVNGLRCTGFSPEIGEDSLVRVVSNDRTHESHSGLLPHHARRPALAAVELDENSKRGLSGAHRQRKYRRTAMAIAAQKREHAAQAYPLGGILFRSRRHGP